MVQSLAGPFPFSLSTIWSEWLINAEQFEALCIAMRKFAQCIRFSIMPIIDVPPVAAKLKCQH